MGSQKSTDPKAYALAVRAEILSELGRRQISLPQLSELIPRKKSYLYERLSQSKRELSLNDVEYICSALRIPISPLMERAEDEMHLYEYQEEPGFQTDQALAAEYDNQQDINEGEMY